MTNPIRLLIFFLFSFSFLSASKIYVKKSDLPLELVDIPDAFEKGIATSYRMIETPGFKYSYNPSITKISPENYLFTFRVDGSEKIRTGKMKVFHSFLKSVILAKDFTPIPSTLRDIDTDNLFSEDPRIVTHNDIHYVFYNENPYIRTDYRNMALTVLSPNLNPLGKVQYLNLTHTIEKNWTPFFDESDNLNFIYTLYPFTINTHARAGHPFFFKQYTATHPYLEQWKKQWGEPHGGTPAVKISDDEYLTIFQSSKVFDNKIRWFFMGAITFSPPPNVEVKKVSMFPIFSTKLYSSLLNPIHTKGKRVTYPAGLVIENDTALVSFGVNDSKCAILSLDLKTLLENTVENHLVEPQDN